MKRFDARFVLPCGRKISYDFKSSNIDEVMKRLMWCAVSLPFVLPDNSKVFVTDFDSGDKYQGVYDGVGISYSLECLWNNICFWNKQFVRC